jgi:hypothetical protein
MLQTWSSRVCTATATPAIYLHHIYGTARPCTTLTWSGLDSSLQPPSHASIRQRAAQGVTGFRWCGAALAHECVTGALQLATNTNITNISIGHNIIQQHALCIRQRTCFCSNCDWPHSCSARGYAVLSCGLATVASGSAALQQLLLDMCVSCLAHAMQDAHTHTDSRYTIITRMMHIDTLAHMPAHSHKCTLTDIQRQRHTHTA